MLVLGRKLNEKIVVRVGETKFTIQVTDLRPGGVRLGFEMPDEVLVDRLEVYESKMIDLELNRQREGGGR